MTLEVKGVTLELTASCNLKCTICPLGTGLLKRKCKTMPYALVDRILYDNPNLERINLNNWGEPLLHPEFFRILSGINTRLPKCQIHFATNGTLLSDSVAEKLLKHRIHEIQFSVDGIDDTYERIRNTKYNEVRERIETFIKRRNAAKNPVRIIIKAVVCKETEDGIEALTKAWTGLADEVRLQPMLEYKEGVRSGPCRELFNDPVVVFTDGRVVPCCSDYNGELELGDAYIADLRTIWNGRMAEAIRDTHKRLKYPKVCQLCTEYKTDRCKERFK